MVGMCRTTGKGNLTYHRHAANDHHEWEHTRIGRVPAGRGRTHGSSRTSHLCNWRAGSGRSRSRTRRRGWRGRRWLRGWRGPRRGWRDSRGHEHRGHHHVDDGARALDRANRLRSRVPVHLQQGECDVSWHGHSARLRRSRPPRRSTSLRAFGCIRTIGTRRPRVPSSPSRSACRQRRA